jgi:hypothetical protein
LLIFTFEAGTSISNTSWCMHMLTAIRSATSSLLQGGGFDQAPPKIAAGAPV